MLLLCVLLILNKVLGHALFTVTLVRYNPKK